MADPVPHDIRLLADERARARRARDWSTADRLKAELANAGWNVVDAGTMYSLEPRPAAVVEVDGEVRYGTSEAVPSRLEEPASTVATAVLVAEDLASVLPRSVDAVLTHSPGTQVVVVANGPSGAVAAEVSRLPREVEVIHLAPRLGAAAARNAGMRRARGAVIVLLSPRLEPAGDIVGALVSQLHDPTVAVAGVEGLVTPDLVHFTAAAPGTVEAAAVGLRAMAFRRSDLVARGPLDEHFTIDAYLDAWWSLALRDVSEDADVDASPRRAVVVELPYTMHGDDVAPPEERLAKKHRYRFLKWFASRRDLIVTGPGSTG